MKSNCFTGFVFIVVAAAIVISSCSNNPVNSCEATREFKNFELYGNLGKGSGVYHTIDLPTTATKVIMVKVRKDEDSSWEEWADWKMGGSVSVLHVYDYSLTISHWDYWITVRAWEFTPC